MNRTRLIYDTLFLLFIIFGVAPIVILLGLIGSFRFRHYGEFMVAGALFELLYGVGGWSLPLPFPMFIGSVLLFVSVVIIRTRLR